ncbi:MAG: hypothetical protein Q4F69_01135 [Bacteroidia bacterium]|nr:hypothetical protein [Bacteroidia bacterium]
MRKITLMVVAAMLALVVTSCGSTKSTVKNMPCPECKATAQVFRYLGQHVAAGDRQIQQARSMAAQSAREELATMVSATVQRVIDNYSNEYIQGDDADFKQRIEGLSRTVVKQLLVGTPVTCEQQMAGSKDGTTICYACVELTGQSVLDGIANKINNDEKLRTDFEYEKFKKVFNEEMGKLE